MLRRACIHVLCPYTTLFRSNQRDERRRDEPVLEREGESRPGRGVASRSGEGRAVGTHGDSVIRCSRSMAGCSIDWVRDRKSTRLNSSHLGISYAVFCLKKKS